MNEHDRHVLRQWLKNHDLPEGLTFKHLNLGILLGEGWPLEKTVGHGFKTIHSVRNAMYDLAHAFELPVRQEVPVVDRLSEKCKERLDDLYAVYMHEDDCPFDECKGLVLTSNA